MTDLPRIFLSPPHMGTEEAAFVTEAFDTNWVAPVGPHVDAFEAEFAEYVGAKHAVALSSGTAALHLALRDHGIGPGDEVLVSDLTFCASVNPILYEGGTPVFVDSERESWNMDPNLVEDAFRARASGGKQFKAIVPVHLYGQTVDMDPIVALCETYGVTIVEDAAEALGATYKGKSPGIFGRAGIFSFNGNKIITTSGGGMLVTDRQETALHVKKMATQARDQGAHYEHSEIGFNYRLSNLLAGVGRGQLRVLDERVNARRAVFAAYVDALGDLPGVEFMPEAEWGRNTRWLTCLTLEPDVFGATPEEVRLALEEVNAEARPVWKPMHLQPIYEPYEFIGGDVSSDLFARGLCLPSGSSMTADDIARVVDTVARMHQVAA